MSLQRRSGGTASEVTGRQTRRAGTPTEVTKLWRRAGGVAVEVASFGGSTPPPTPTVYNEKFTSGLGIWQAGSAASNLVRDTTRFPDGALMWTATGGNTTIRTLGTSIVVQPSTTYRIELRVANGAATFRGFNGGVDTYTAAQGYTATQYSGYTGVAAGATATLTKTFTTTATTGLARFTLMVVESVAGEQFWLDEATIFGPL